MVASRTNPKSPKSQGGYVNFSLEVNRKTGFQGSIQGHHIQIPRFPFTARDIKKCVSKAALVAGGLLAGVYSPTSTAHNQSSPPPEPPGIVYVVEKPGAAASSGRPDSAENECADIKPELVRGRDGQRYYLVMARKGCTIALVPGGTQ